MKKYLIYSCLFISFPIFSQCVKCRSLEEAAKKPEIVKSIQINPVFGGELKEVPLSIAVFVNLEELYLSDLELKTIPKEIGSLTKLKRLSLAGNTLKELPEEIFKLKKLEELILLDNQFSEAYKKKIQKLVTAQLPRTKLFID
jgi:hypothetical protein